MPDEKLLPKGVRKIGHQAALAEQTIVDAEREKERAKSRRAAPAKRRRRPATLDRTEARTKRFFALEELTVAKLRKIAKRAHADFNTKTTKPELVKRILDAEFAR